MKNKIRAALRRLARFLLESDESYYDTGFSWSGSKPEDGSRVYERNGDSR